MASKSVSLRLNDEQIARLDHAAQKAGQTRAEMAATLLEQALRLSEYPSIVLRDFGAGPEMFISGTRLRVWQVESLAQEFDHDVAKVARHFNLLEPTIKSALAYAAAYPEEIQDAIEDNQRRADELERALSTPRTVSADLTVNAPAP